MVKKPLFWLGFLLIFAVSVIFSFHYFPRAFPLVTLDLQMDRLSALQSAKSLAQTHQWGPQDFRQAASFRLDVPVQYFVELEAGGNKAFAEMLAGDLYSPYTWQVRHFREGDANESLIRFTPEGSPYGFVETLPEEQPGASLPVDSAQAIAESAAANTWGIDLSDYTLVETSREVRPGGRTDHTFVYERPDVKIGEGLYRLQLVVGGDRLTELTHFVKIPEAFSRRYEEMRSANQTIGVSALIVAAVLFLGVGGIVGLFFLLRQRWVLWRKPLLWGIFIAALQLLAGINQFPLTWMNYDTAVSAEGFLLRQIVQLVGGFLFLSVVFTISFMAAESLSRKAFPHHLQQWRLWSKEVAGSSPVLGRAVAGYLLVAFFFAYEVILYFFTTNVLGWWVPSEALFQPDVLATYFPWLTSIAVSAQAGFWEESLFRAIPIAGAALIGQRLGGRKAWIAAAFVVQALVFGAGHATYAQQPPYARVLELIIPSIAFGAIYLRFGLYPAMILHYGVDVAWIALPLFVSKAPGVWIDQSMVILLLLVPLWITLLARLRIKRWNELKDEHYNLSWAPAVKEAPPETVPEAAPAEPQTPSAIGSMTRRVVLIGGLIGVLLWVFSTTFQNHVPPLAFGRDEAVEQARKDLAERGFELSEDWKVLGMVESPLEQDDRFIWQTGGEQPYTALMGSYLTPPYWKIRFARFEGDVVERAEEFRLYMSTDRKLFRLTHQLPETRPGPTLAEEEARMIADSLLLAEYQLQAANLKEVSAVPSKLPERQDWRFTFSDTAGYPLEEGEARIAVKIAGNEAVDSYRYIHVPEEWDRQERKVNNINQTLRAICGLLLFVLLLAGAVAAVVRWSRKQFSVRHFLVFAGVLLLIRILALGNNWPARIAYFSTAEPWGNQVLMTISIAILQALFIAAGLGLIIGFIQEWKSGHSLMKTSAALGMGLSLGALLAGLEALIARLSPSMAPLWANYQPIQAYFPFVEDLSNPLLQFILATTLLLLIFTVVDRFTNGWQKKKGLFSGLFLLIGVVISGADNITTISSWLAGGIIMGIAYWLLYVYVFRFQLALIPLVTATSLILKEVQQGVMNAYPGAISGAALAIIILGLAAFYWYRQLGNGQLSISEPTE